MPTRTARISVNRHGIPLAARLSSILVNQKSKTDIVVTARDETGNVVDLTEFGFDGDTPPTVEFRFADAARPLAATKVAGTCDSPETGELLAGLTSAHTGVAGIYRGEAAILDSDKDVALSQSFYLWVQPSLFGGISKALARDEVRLHLRDSQPDENLLLDEIDFDDAELCQAISRAIAYWNEALPPGKVYGTGNFPFKTNLLDGAIAGLCQTAAEHYRRNFVPVTAGGIGYQDLAKEQNYLIEGQRRWTQYTEWVRNKKMSINLGSATATVSSSYR